MKNTSLASSEFNGKLAIKEKVGYALGDVASNLYFQTFILFLTYFYTDIFGLTAASVATLMLVTRIGDAITDPLMGIVSDRTETKMGKYRPYLIWFAVPFGICGFLLFTTPDLDYQGKLIFAYVTYTAMILLYTIVNVPYSALMGVLTHDPKERTVVSSYRIIGALIAGLTIQASLLVLVRKLGSGNEQLGWQITMGILSIIVVILLFLTFFWTKERVKPVITNNLIKDDIVDLVKNPAWIIIGIVSLFQLIFQVVKSGCIMYYFKYYIQEIEVFGTMISFEAGASIFILTGTFVSIAGAMRIGATSRKIDKRKAYIFNLSLFALSSSVLYIFTPDDFILIVLSQLLAAYTIGALAALQWSMFPDAADYSEWKTGRRATGLLMAGSLFMIKMGGALGGAILGGLLAYYGFEANVDQTPQALIGIRMISSVYPAVFAGICIILVYFYPITRQLQDEIDVTLQKRREVFESTTG